MSEKKFRQAAIAGMLPRQPQPPMTAEELDGPPWDGQYGADGMPKITPPAPGVLPDLPWEERGAETAAIRERPDSAPIAEGLRPFHEELHKRHERADSRSIGRWSKRKGTPHRFKAGHKVATHHPWRNPKPSEAPAVPEDRFSQAPRPVIQHVRAGEPLTETGEKLLNRPQDVVVSPPENPAHSKQTKQVHQYQQRPGRK